MTEWTAALEATPFATWLRESGSIWAYPLVLTLHTAGMGVLVGTNWTLDLRVLGVARGIPLPALAGLWPAMWVGFGVNLVTGVMLFAADATTKGSTPVFAIKIGLVVAAVVATVLMKRGVTHALPDRPLPGPARLLAATSITLWIGAIATGRLMAYV